MNGFEPFYMDVFKESLTIIVPIYPILVQVRHGVINEQREIVDLDTLHRPPRKNRTHMQACGLHRGRYVHLQSEGRDRLPQINALTSFRAMFVAPLAHPVQQRDQGFSRIGERILHLRRHLGIHLPVNKTVLLQLFERCA